MGQRIGPYELVGELGRGGAGVIYRAVDTGLQREVALKVLGSGKAATPASLARFQREAEALARLRHPHVVRVHAAGQHEGLPYLVMDLVEGRSLADVLAEAGPLSVERALEIALALAQALEHVHAQGMLHRDLKPANVLLTRDGTPQLTDFGLAKVQDSEQGLSREGALLGTPGYWPPEQATGQLQRIGPASDVYALGATLYAMLTGVPPIEGESVRELLVATCERVPAPPSTLRPGVPPALDAICARCLAKSVGARYPDATALAAALAQAQAGEHDDSGARRSRAIVAALGGLALAVGAAVAWRGPASAPGRVESQGEDAGPALPAEPLARCLAELEAGLAPSGLAAAELALVQRQGDEALRERIEGLPPGPSRDRLLALAWLRVGADDAALAVLGEGRSPLHRAAELGLALTPPPELEGSAVLLAAGPGHKALASWLEARLRDAEELARRGDPAAAYVIAVRTQTTWAWRIAQIRAIQSNLYMVFPRATFERARALAPGAPEEGPLVVVEDWLYKDLRKQWPDLVRELDAQVAASDPRGWPPLFVFLRGFQLVHHREWSGVPLEVIVAGGEQALATMSEEPLIGDHFMQQVFGLQAGLAQAYMRQACDDFLATRRAPDRTRLQRAFELALGAMFDPERPSFSVPALADLEATWLDQGLRLDRDSLRTAAQIVIWAGRPDLLEVLLVRLDAGDEGWRAFAALARAEADLLRGEPAIALARLEATGGHLRDAWGLRAHAYHLRGDARASDQALAQGARLEALFGFPWHDPVCVPALRAGDLWWPGRSGE